MEATSRFTCGTGTGRVCLKSGCVTGFIRQRPDSRYFQECVRWGTYVFYWMYIYIVTCTYTCTCIWCIIWNVSLYARKKISSLLCICTNACVYYSVIALIFYIFVCLPVSPCTKDSSPRSKSQEHFPDEWSLSEAWRPGNCKVRVTCMYQ